MQPKRRAVKCEALESRLFLSGDTASLVNPPGISGVTSTSTTVDHIAVVYFGSSVDASTFGDHNLVITGPNAFPGTIQFVGLGHVDSTLVGLEKIADYDITETVPTSDNGNTYTLSVAPNQVSDGQGGTFPAQTLGTFQVQIPIPTTPPITLLNADGTTLAPGSTLDFGTVQFSSTQPPVSKTIGIRNDGSAPISVSEAVNEIGGFGGVPFTFVPPASDTINPGQTATVTVTLNVHILTLNLGPLNTAFDVTVADPSPFIHYTPVSLNLSANVIAPLPRVVTTIDVTSRKPAVFTDASGSKVNVHLSGPGTATLGFGTTGNANITDLTLSNTTGATSLTITPVGGGDSRTSITGNISITGSLSRFNAARVDLAGGVFNVSGAIGNLTLGNVSGLESLNITGLEIGHPATHLHLTAGNFVDTSLSTAQPIASIHVASWTDTHAFDSQLGTANEQILAPSLAELSSRGDFTVGLNLVSNGSLGRAAVGGSLGSDPWVIGGNAGDLRLGAIPAAFSGTIGGKLVSLTVARDDAGTLAAGHIGQIIIGGNLTGAKILAGVNLGIDGRIGTTNGNGQDTYASGSINSLQVGGMGTNVFVSAGFQPNDGLFDNTSGKVIGGPASFIRKIVFRHGLDANSRFVAGAFKTANIPNKVNPATDSHFVLL